MLINNTTKDLVEASLAHRMLLQRWLHKADAVVAPAIAYSIVLALCPKCKVASVAASQ